MITKFKQLKTCILLMVLMNMNTMAIAQGDPGLPGEDPDVPIDGGVGLLLLAGAAYGIKKIREMNS
ncbi:PID-CTERM protein-sorting domain-containing protein [Pedobacter frigoris]|uniref:PID-CTERM protein-sorting domain-containing protein n=1 Tax=Pedobacter frigoris TaxID=2571272 RepID=UPI0029318E0C|nr:hypothetical protein [Pedobacter frigoris]